MWHDKNTPTNHHTDWYSQHNSIIWSIQPNDWVSVYKQVLQVRVSWQSPKKLKCFWKSFDSANNCVNVPLENYFEFIIFLFFEFTWIFRTITHRSRIKHSLKLRVIYEGKSKRECVCYDNLQRIAYKAYFWY